VIQATPNLERLRWMAMMQGEHDIFALYCVFASIN